MRYASIALSVALVTGVASAQTPPAEPEKPRHSICHAFAERAPETDLPIVFARFADGLEKGEVGLSFLGHASWLIQTAGGVAAITDYDGWSAGVPPTLVTMNKAHETHFTDTPDPAIAHVLRGWRDDGAPAGHDVTVGDLRVRSVSTDIVRYSGAVEADANAIFVFEVADLCIGHLGHLHHVPTTEQLAEIGFLDVVMAPVDGGYTLSLPKMIETMRLLRARLIVPMHWFGPFTLERFVSDISAEFPVERRDGPTIVISKRTLPREPTVWVVPPVYPESDN